MYANDIHLTRLASFILRGTSLYLEPTFCESLNEATNVQFSVGCYFLDYCDRTDQEGTARLHYLIYLSICCKLNCYFDIVAIE